MARRLLDPAARFASACTGHAEAERSAPLRPPGHAVCSVGPCATVRMLNATGRLGGSADGRDRAALLPESGSHHCGTAGEPGHHGDHGDHEHADHRY
jgi:hypothetical protein